MSGRPREWGPGTCCVCEVRLQVSKASATVSVLLDAVSKRRGQYLPDMLADGAVAAGAPAMTAPFVSRPGQPALRDILVESRAMECLGSSLYLPLDTALVRLHFENDADLSNIAQAQMGCKATLVSSDHNSIKLVVLPLDNTNWPSEVTCAIKARLKESYGPSTWMKNTPCYGIIAWEADTHVSLYRPKIIDAKDSLRESPPLMHTAPPCVAGRPIDPRSSVANSEKIAVLEEVKKVLAEAHARKRKMTQSEILAEATRRVCERNSASSVVMSSCTTKDSGLANWGHQTDELDNESTGPHGAHPAMNFTDAPLVGSNHAEDISSIFSTSITKTLKISSLYSSRLPRNTMARIAQSTSCQIEVFDTGLKITAPSGKSFDECTRELRTVILDAQSRVNGANHLENDGAGSNLTGNARVQKNEEAVKYMNRPPAPSSSSRVSLNESGKGKQPSSSRSASPRNLDKRRHRSRSPSPTNRSVPRQFRPSSPSAQQQRCGPLRSSEGTGRSRSPRRRPQSPRGRSRSPRGRSMSPRRRPRSPRGRSRSPRRRSRSPRRRSRSPRRRSRSPRGRSMSPRDRGRQNGSRSLRSRSPYAQGQRDLSQGRSGESKHNEDALPADGPPGHHRTSMVNSAQSFMQRSPASVKIYLDKVNIPGFSLRDRKDGHSAQKLAYIMGETGCFAELRGRGSGTLISGGYESSAPMHIFLEHQNQDQLKLAKSMCETQSVDLLPRPLQAPPPLLQEHAQVPDFRTELDSTVQAETQKKAVAAKQKNY